MAKKNALGRGLGALIDDAEEKEQQPLVEEKIVAVNEIRVDKIEENPFQPRTKFDKESLEELADSIKEMGIIQPITVRDLGNNKYQLIAGERRLKASKIAKLESIPAYVRDANDNEMLEMALVENIQREDLDAIEIAISYQRLIDECNLTQENLGNRVGKKRATVTNYLRLLKLPAEIQLGIRNRELSMGHARALINIPDGSDQLKIYHKTIDQDLSVRKVEDLVRKLAEAKAAGPESNTDQQKLPEEYEELRLHLTEYFKTNVDFKRDNKGKGKIVISFRSDDELERIISIFDSFNTK